MRILLIACMVLLQGCVAATKTERYMIAVEDNGQAALYRVTAKLKGGANLKYKLVQGYVAANVADRLAGDIDDPKDFYAPVSEQQLRDTARQSIEKSRLETLERLAKDSDTTAKEIDNTRKRYGAIQAAADLSVNDQASAGAIGSTNPYAFRKLVTMASTSVIDLKVYETEVKAIENSISDLTTALKTAREAKAARAKAKREARWRAINSVIEANN